MPETANTIAREIANGIWFFMNVALWLTFVIFIGRRISDIKRQYTIGWIDAFKSYVKGVWLRREIGDSAAVALVIYMTGATLRAGYVWALLIIQNAEYNSEGLERWYGLMFVSAALAITGAMCAVRIFTPARWSPWIWRGTLFLAITVPTLIHWLL